jgi:predicted porin
MIWGLGLRSRLLIAAGITLMGGLVTQQTPARAADLGGDCCADLEDRVAELEATTARKGNKKVSVTVYGQVNRAVLFWDDGAESNIYSVDNNYESSRFGFKGSAKIAGNWSAGYRMEVETTIANSARVNQIDDDNATDPVGPLAVRHSFLYLNNKNLGELRLGLTATPIYNITKDTNVTELEDTMHSDFRMNQGFFLRPKGYNKEIGNALAPAPPPPGNSTLKWQNISSCYSSNNDFVCSTRRNGVAYWSPTWEGFSVSWGWFEDDIWGAALRYKKEWGENWEAGGGIGYENFTDERIQNGGGGLAGFHREINEWAGSASIKHKPTGLFAFGAFSVSDDDDSNRIDSGIYTHTSSPEMTAWDVQIGIQRKFGALGQLGDSSFWGGFTRSNDGIGGACGPTRACKAFTLPTIAIPTEITGSQVDRWSLAFDQALDAANMHLYVAYQHLTADIDLVDKNFEKVNAPLDDFNLVYTGARIYF